MTYDGEGPITEDEAKAKVAEAEAELDDDEETPPEPLEHELVDEPTEGGTNE